MSATVILFIVMALCLMAWVIGCAVHFVLGGRELLNASGQVAHCTCESCGATFDVPAGELGRSWLSKQASVTRTRREGAALVDEPSYLSFAKRLTCPHCHERAWVQVANVNEINASLRGAYLALGLKHIAAMVAGGFLILAIVQIVLGALRALGLQ